MWIEWDPERLKNERSLYLSGRLSVEESWEEHLGDMVRGYI